MSIGTPQFEDFTGFTPFNELGPYRAADYLKLPEGERVELIRGRLIRSPSRSVLHQIVLGNLSLAFFDVDEKTGGITFISPLDVVLSNDTILQPDLLYISKERRRIITEYRVEGVPDLVIEVIQPETGRRDKTEKLDLYAKYEVPECWIVDPATQVFEFLLLKQSRYVVIQLPDNRYRSPRLPEIKIDLAAFWAEIDRRLPKS